MPTEQLNWADFAQKNPEAMKQLGFEYRTERDITDEYHTTFWHDGNFVMEIERDEQEEYCAALIRDHIVGMVLADDLKIRAYDQGTPSGAGEARWYYIEKDRDLLQVERTLDHALAAWVESRAT